MSADPHIALAQTAAPTDEPVEVADILAHCRIDATDEDAPYIASLIGTARRWVEQITGRQLITSTRTMSLDAFPCGEIRLPGSPVQSITSITYTDSAGDAQTWAADQYQADLISVPARVAPAYGVVYPGTQTGVYNAVTITYVAGYGDAKTDVPQDIRHAIMLLVAHWYENREPVNIGNIVSDIPMGAQFLLAPYRIQRFGGWA